MSKLLADNLVVKKFGGSMLSTMEDFEIIAEHLALHRHTYNQVVVLSAPFGKTNDLLDEICKINPQISATALSLMLSTGEQYSLSLMGAFLEAQGLSVAYLGQWNIPILTTTDIIDSVVTGVQTESILNLFNQHDVILVAGFQGLTPNNEISTLGRGGSDTTACALACALKAPCIFYKDVGGIYTKDPAKDPLAQLISSLSYEQVLELSASGARVIHQQAANLMCLYQPTVFFTNLSENQGTSICNIYQMKINSVEFSKDKYFEVFFEKNLNDLTNILKNIEIISIKSLSNGYKVLFKLIKATRISVDVDNRLLTEVLSMMYPRYCIEIFGAGFHAWPEIKSKILLKISNLDLNSLELVFDNFKVLAFLGDNNDEPALKALTQLLKSDLMDEPRKEEMLL